VTRVRSRRARARERIPVCGATRRTPAAVREAGRRRRVSIPRGRTRGVRVRLYRAPTRGYGRRLVRVRGHRGAVRPSPQGRAAALRLAAPQLPEGRPPYRGRRADRVVLTVALAVPRRVVRVDRAAVRSAVPRVAHVARAVAHVARAVALAAPVALAVRAAAHVDGAEDARRKQSLPATPDTLQRRAAQRGPLFFCVRRP